MDVVVVLHRAAFPDQKHPNRPRYVRLPQRQQSGQTIDLATDLTGRAGLKYRLLPGRYASVAGRPRRVLGYGFEFGVAVVHLAR